METPVSDNKVSGPPGVVLRWDEMPEELRAELLGEQERCGELSPERQLEIFTAWLARNNMVEGNRA
jgi:hypothetical protein